MANDIFIQFLSIEYTEILTWHSLRIGLDRNKTSSSHKVHPPWYRVAHGYLYLAPKTQLPGDFLYQIVDPHEQLRGEID